MTTRLYDHSLILTLRSLRGNVRGAVLTEPMWAIPYNLYAPFVSVYMLALGLGCVWPLAHNIRNRHR